MQSMSNQEGWQEHREHVTGFLDRKRIGDYVLVDRVMLWEKIDEHMWQSGQNIVSAIVLAKLGEIFGDPLPDEDCVGELR